MPRKVYQQFLERERITDAADLQGRRIRAAGMVSLYDVFTEMKINDLRQIELLPLDEE